MLEGCPPSRQFRCSAPARHRRAARHRYGGGPPGRPGLVAGARPVPPPMARAGGHLRRGDPARARDARPGRGAGGVRARAVRLGHQLDRPGRAAVHPGRGHGRRPAGLRLVPAAGRPRLHAGRARRRAAVLPRRPRRPVHLLGNSLGGAIALGGGRATARAGAHAHPRVARHARPPARPAAGVGPRLALALLPGRRGARPGRAGRDGPARPMPSRWCGVCFGDPTCVPEHRLAEAVAEIAARRRQEWAQEAGDRTAKAMLRQLVARRLAVGGRPRGCRRRRWSSGATATGSSPRAWPPARHGRLRGRGC